MKTLLVFIPLIAVLFIDISLPFVGPYGNNNATYALQAKNYVRFGYLQTNFAPLSNPGEKFPSNPAYYLHHPPLLQMLVSFSFRLFGPNYWSARLIPITATIISTILLMILARMLWGKYESQIVPIVVATLPMTVVFGKLLQFEPILLPFVIGSSIFFLSYSKKPQLKTLLFLVVTITFGFLADWIMLFYALLLACGYLWFAGIKRAKNFVISILVVITVLSLSYIYYTMQVTHDPTLLLRAYLGRSIQGPPFNQENAVVLFITTILLRMVIYFTPLGIVALCFGSKHTFGKISKHARIENLILTLLLILPIANVVFFPNGAWEHPYWLFYFIPFISLSATKLIHQLFRNTSKATKIIVVIAIITNMTIASSIMYIKHVQVTKAIWQEPFIKNALPYLKNDTEIGVNWDFNDDFLRYEADKPVANTWSKNNLLEYLDTNPRNWHHFIFACWANCYGDEKKYADALKARYKILYYSPNAILIDLSGKNNVTEITNETTSTKENKSQNTKPFMEFLIDRYRQLRNFLTLEQI